MSEPQENKCVEVEYDPPKQPPPLKGGLAVLDDDMARITGLVDPTDPGMKSEGGVVVQDYLGRAEVVATQEEGGSPLHRSRMARARMAGMLAGFASNAGITPEMSGNNENYIKSSNPVERVTGAILNAHDPYVHNSFKQWFGADRPNRKYGQPNKEAKQKDGISVYKTIPSPTQPGKTIVVRKSSKEIAAEKAAREESLQREEAAKQAEQDRIKKHGILE